AAGTTRKSPSRPYVPRRRGCEEIAMRPSVAARTRRWIERMFPAYHPIMRFTAGGDTAVWDVECPALPSRVPGVRMAGFHARGMPESSLRAIPHPAVTVILDFGADPPVIDDAGRQRRGSLVAGAGLGHGGTVQVRGENVECVQVRLSPGVARALLGASP